MDFGRILRIEGTGTEMDNIGYVNGNRESDMVGYRVSE